MREAMLASELYGEEVESETLRDFLFTRAGNPPASGRAVSDAAALRFMRKSLIHCVAIAANSGTSPEVLAKFAKDQRVAVRHAAVTNPSLPEEELLYLLKWLFRRDMRQEHAAYATQIHRLSARSLVELSRDIESHCSWNGVQLADDQLRSVALKLASDPDAFAEARISSFNGLEHVMARLALSGSLRGVTLKQVFDKLDARFDDDGGSSTQRAVSMVWDLLESGGFLTHELVDLWPGGQGVRRFRGLTPAALVEPGVLERLAEGPHDHLEIAILNRAPEHLVAARIDEAPPQVLEALVSTLGTGYLSAESEARLGARLADHSARAQIGSSRSNAIRMVGSFLSGCRSILPEDVMVALLRSGSMMVTSLWLSPREETYMTSARSAVPGLMCVQPVTAGLLEQLEEDPGRATDRDDGTGRGRMYGGHLPQGWAGLMGELLEASRGCAAKGRIVCRLLGPDLSSHMLRYGGRKAACIHAYLKEEMGEDLDHWSAFLKLSPDWEGSIGDLIEAASILTSG